MKAFSLITAAAIAALSGAAVAQSATYKVEPTHTFVNWEAKHFGTSTSRGRFDKKDGEITLDKTAGTGKATITIDMASINTGVAPFDRHLRSADFFDAEKHPTATFKTGDFKLTGGKTGDIAGELTMLGVTKPVTLKTVGFNCYQNPMFRKEVCGGDFETTIKRSEFGMKYGLPGIPDDIKLTIQIEAVVQ
jgi:polyisoprenoid-binding protein YceI